MIAVYQYKYTKYLTGFILNVAIVVSVSMMSKNAKVDRKAVKFSDGAR